MKFGKYLIITVVVALLAVTSSVQAQNAGRKNAGPPAGAAQPADSPAKLRNDFIKATQEYKTSLGALAATYDKHVKDLADRQSKLKELYDAGIISKKELDESDGEVVEARAKADEARKEMAEADVAIANAMKEPAVPPPTITSVKQWQNVAWTTGSAYMDTLIRQNGSRFGVDPYLIYCVMQQESHFNPLAVSAKGAQGLMQLMPDTAARFGVINPFDAQQNVMGGARYLKDLLQMFGGRIDLTLASYNAGAGAVLKFGQRVPPYKETQDYVRLISMRYSRALK